ncbi:PspC domain-containing protein [Nanoarchaeota archaeon]
MKKKTTKSRTRTTRSKPEPKRLYRSKKDKIIAGVCGGIAEHFNVDPIWIRLAAVLLIFANGLGLVLYILAWILIPQNPRQSGADTTAERTAKDVHSKISRKHSENVARKRGKPVHEKPCRSGVSFMGVFFVFLGTVLLMNNLFNWFTAAYGWALAFIAFGGYLIARRLVK